MRPARLATTLLLGSFISFSTTCGRLDLGTGFMPSPRTIVRHQYPRRCICTRDRAGLCRTSGRGWSTDPV